MDEALIGYMRRHHNLLIGEASAEKLKREIGTACPSRKWRWKINGNKRQDLINGVPKEVILQKGSS